MHILYKIKNLNVLFQKLLGFCSSKKKLLKIIVSQSVLIVTE